MAEQHGNLDWSRRRFLRFPLVAGCALGLPWTGLIRHGMAQVNEPLPAESPPILGEQLLIRMPPFGRDRSPPVVTAIAAIPQASLVATAGDDHRILLWSVKDGQLVRELRGHRDWIRSLDYHPGKNLLASCSDDGDVRLWRIDQAESFKTCPGLAESVHCVRFHPDGGQVAALGFRGKLCLLDVTTGETIYAVDCPCGDMRVLAFSPRGRHIAGAGRNGKLRIWNADDGSIEREFVAHGRRVRGLEFSPDGSVLVSSGEDGLIRFWDPTTGNELNTLRHEMAKVFSLRFCGPGFLATGATDNKIRLWDLYTMRTAAIFQGHTGSVACLSLDEKSNAIISGGFDTTVRIWSLSNAVAIGPHGEQVAGGFY